MKSLAHLAPRYGWHIVPLEPRSKFTKAKDWGLNGLRDQREIEDFYTRNPDWNAGIILGPSRVCALDIDAMADFEFILENLFGQDIRQFDNVPSIQGRPGRKQVLFRMPDTGEVVLTTKQASWQRTGPDGKPSSHTIFELRGSTNPARQALSVLPPSIHPDTNQPYTWLVPPPDTLDEWPTLPAWLLEVWCSWADINPDIKALDPEYVPPPRPERRLPTIQYDPTQETPIDRFNRENYVLDVAEAHGYRRRGERLLSPYSTTGAAGCYLAEDGESLFIKHGSDPLGGDKPRKAFDFYAHFQHDGDVSKAAGALARMYGMAPPKRERPQQPPHPATIIETPPTPNLVVGNVAELARELKREEPPVQQIAFGLPKWAPFKPLGFAGDDYYYMPHSREELMSIKRGGHTTAAQMLGLAGLDFWSNPANGFIKESGAIDWIAAGDVCMRACEAAGYYSPDRVRGKGAWLDDGRCIVHLGDRVSVDGKIMRLSEVESEWIYNRRSRSSDTQAPASDTVTSGIAETFELLNWMRPIDAKLLAGALMIAPVCGALDWRPHVWITAPSGAGKSWIFDEMVNVLLGRDAYFALSLKTSEAAIRNSVNGLGFAASIDEFEAETPKEMECQTEVLTLIRAASKRGSAPVAKGKQGGDGVNNFYINSMFIVGSVGVNLTQQSDMSRFAVLDLYAGDDKRKFTRLQGEVAERITAESAAAWRTRAHANAITIRQNIEALKGKISDITNNTRRTDTYAPLIAGYIATQHTRIMTEQEIEAAVELFMDAINPATTDDESKNTDQQRCLDTILTASIDIGVDGGLRREQVSTLIQVANGTATLDDSSWIGADAARAALKRHGMDVRDEMLLVSQSHNAIKQMMKDTPWVKNFARILLRLKGADKNDGKVFKIGTLATRGVRIPLESIREVEL